MIKKNWILLIIVLIACHNVQNQKEINQNHLDDLPNNERSIPRIIKPFESIKFENGDWKCIINISNSDLSNLPIDLNRRQTFVSSNIETLKRLCKLEFIETGKDIATIESTFRILHNGAEYQTFEIILENGRVGLQNRLNGWIEAVHPDSVINIIKSFY